MTLRLSSRRVGKMAAQLALAMLVADLSGRARVLLEAERATGERFRAAKGLSFEESRGGLAVSMATAAAPAIFDSPCEGASAGVRDAAPVSRVLLKAKNQSDLFAEEGEAQVLAPAKLEPKEALDFFRQKLAMTRPAFNKLAKRYRDTAFTVANVESVKLIEEIQGELDRAIAQGLTRADFTKAVNARFRSAGLAPLDPFHLETVFRTNVASAYSAGRASQMLHPDVRKALPWWEYHTIGDSRVRDEHAVLDGFLARWDDRVWSKIYPPNGYNCRCLVTAMTEREARRLEKSRGLDLSRSGLERLPADAKIDFDNSPAVSLARTAKGAEAPGASAKPPLSAKEVTAKAVALREKTAEKYERAKAKAERLERETASAQKAVQRASVADLPARWRDLDAASKPAAEARAAFRALKADFDRKLHELVRPAAGLRVQMNSLSRRVDAGRVRVWEAGVREFNRLVAVGPSSAQALFRAGRGKRSGFDPETFQLHISKEATVRSVVHEMGHWLEHQDPRVMAAAMRFLERRTKGETALPLRRLTGARYGRGEVAKIDKFLDVYMGKVYPEGHGTEIVAVGLEWLYDEPYRLLDDPDYFEFLIGVLHGEGL